MGIMSKFRGLMGMPEDEDYLDDDLDYVTGSHDTEEIKAASIFTDEVKRPNKVVNIAATTQLAVVLVKPERFDDASSVADHLNAKRTVVLNLEQTNKETARRLVDFLSGVAYANKGTIKRVANSTFIITPYNVDFMGDLLDELESNGVFF